MPAEPMHLADAQREVRRVFFGGFAGQILSTVVWLLSAALGALFSWSVAMWALVIGGVFIFFALEAGVRLAGRKPSLSVNNPLNPLAMQAAFSLPLLLPLIVAAFWYRHDWLYPAFMVGLGVHYLPFMFLFGMWQFGALGLLLVGSGVVFGLSAADGYLVSGWYGAVIQLVFALICLDAYRRERREEAA